MPTQQADRAQAVFAPPAARPVPYLKTDKFKFLGDYGESPDITGGMGGEGVDAFAKFLDAGGTLICTGNAVQVPDRARHGAHRRRVGVDHARVLRAAAAHQRRDRQAGAPGVLRLHREDHPDQVSRRPADVGRRSPIRRRCSARYAGRRRERAERPDARRRRDRATGRSRSTCPAATRGKGRVVLFSNNPIYRWQNHGEFNMVFNAHAELERSGRRAAPPKSTSAAGGR